MSLPPGPEAGPHTDAVPVCPRHPDRESYVRCQRCERPVCPQCQRPAAVGVQCVDCVREGARSTRTTRTIFGGRATGSAQPRVTQAIIAACVAVFLLQLTRGASFTAELSFYPPQALAQPWRFLTSAFLHSTSFLPHILFNMYALWIVGPYLEGLLGRVRFALLYVVSAIGGSVGYFAIVPATGSVFTAGAWETSAIGASGAVFGLFAALLVVNRRLGRDTAGIIGLIAINAALAFVVQGIAWQAHLGGFVTGAAVAAALTFPPRRYRDAAQVLALAVVVALLVLLVAWKASTVPLGLLA